MITEQVSVCFSFVGWCMIKYNYIFLSLCVFFIKTMMISHSIFCKKRMGLAATPTLCCCDDFSGR